MELTATYKELSSYIQARFGQPVSLSAGEDGELKVTYTKRILIKDVNVSIYLHFDEITADTVVLSYKGALGLDMIVGGALSFFTAQFSELAAGIHPLEGHRIRICLSEIEKARPVVENIALQAITPCADFLKIKFRLRVGEK